MRWSDIITNEQFQRAKRRLERDLAREGLWRRTERFNSTLTLHGRTAVVFPVRNQFTFLITSDTETTYSHERYSTQRQAMDAAKQALEK